MLSFSQADNCPRCHKHVFFADELLAMGKKWHLECFTCSKCKKAIDQTGYSNNGADYTIESNDVISCSQCSGNTLTNGSGPNIALTVGKSLDEEDDTGYRCTKCKKVIINNTILKTSPSKNRMCSDCCT
ncbi:hypothetical protein SNE40_006833 [Patella caerulea]|uniref:LIM zinc-binding domain-containing protein n=1 Tax=Patella caerulea TaxID=87958 RepID=A0AAN8JWQ8_PATCE